MLLVVKVYYILTILFWGRKPYFYVYVFYTPFYGCASYSLIFENNINPENKPHTEWWELLEHVNDHFKPKNISVWTEDFYFFCFFFFSFQLTTPGFIKFFQ